jgi:carbamoyl-phosphate synthase large subunit
MKQGKVELIINTPSSRSPRKDEVTIRSNAVAHGIPLITTVSGASAAVNAIQMLLREEPRVKALQDYLNPGDLPVY